MKGVGTRIMILCIAVLRTYAGSYENLWLRACVLLGKCEKVQIWLDAGADPNYLVNGDKEDTLLHAAAFWESRYEALELLLKAGAEVNAQNAKGDTPLHKAATFRNRRAMLRLLAAGADPEVRNHRGKTPLHGARVPAVKVLLEAGANMEVRDIAGRTPLRYAVCWRPDYQEEACMLARHGADVTPGIEKVLVPAEWGVEVLQARDEYLRLVRRWQQAYLEPRLPSDLVRLTMHIALSKCQRNALDRLYRQDQPPIELSHAVRNRRPVKWIKVDGRWRKQ